MLKRFAGEKLCGLAGLSLFFSFVPGQLNAQTSPIATGIEGVISIGPTHGGPIRSGESASAPLANFAFVVAGAAGGVAAFTTDRSGHFRIPLAPGRHSIKLRKPSIALGHTGRKANSSTGIRWSCR
jgi:hypothetical protein